MGDRMSEPCGCGQKKSPDALRCRSCDQALRMTMAVGTQKPYTCQRCGIAFGRRRKRLEDDALRFCSQKCWQDGRRECSLSRRSAREAACVTRLARQVVHQERHAQRQAQMGPRACRGCGTCFIQARMNQTYCQTCISRRGSAVAKATIRCRECAFTPVSPLARACSARCSRKAARRVEKARYRARKRGAGLGPERIDPTAVFMSDGWHCRGCGCDTPAGMRGTNADNAPTLDHIVPVARGGQHVRSNVQTLCRRCNCRKGASLTFEAA